VLCILAIAVVVVAVVAVLDFNSLTLHQIRGILQLECLQLSVQHTHTHIIIYIDRHTEVLSSNEYTAKERETERQR
jgi:hypothetical protein